LAWIQLINATPDLKNTGLGIRKDARTQVSASSHPTPLKEGLENRKIFAPDSRFDTLLKMGNPSG